MPKAAKTQVDIAKPFGVSRGFISSVENGKRNPTLTTITRLANAVGVTTD